jgi:hypothetical protein
MSAAESLGSHQLNSFAAFLEEKLHTSSENSIVQIPHLKKMANGKKPQKGGKRPEVNTAFEIPDDIYKDYCTPDETKFGKETKTAQGAHPEDREEMGKRVEGVQVCYSQVHEEIHTQSSMPKTSIGTWPRSRSH